MLALLKKIPRQVVIYIVLTVVALGLGAFGGYTFCKRAQYKGVIKQQQKDATIVEKHQERKDEADKEVAIRLEQLRVTQDSSNCLDVNSPDNYLEQLQRADSTAKSIFN